MQDDYYSRAPTAKKYKLLYPVSAEESTMIVFLRREALLLPFFRGATSFRCLNSLKILELGHFLNRESSNPTPQLKNSIFAIFQGAASFGIS